MHLGSRNVNVYISPVSRDPDELREEASRYRTLARKFEGTVLAEALRSSAEACDELAETIQRQPYSSSSPT